MEAYILKEWDKRKISVYVSERAHNAREFYFFDPAGGFTRKVIGNDEVLDTESTIRPLLVLPMGIGDDILQCIAREVTGKDLAIMEKAADRSLDAYNILSKEHERVAGQFDKILDAMLTRVAK